MELHAMNGKPPVGKAHYFVVVGPGGHLELLGQACPLDGQGVITGDSKRIIQPNKYASAKMLDLRCLAMHKALSLQHLGAKGLTNGLMPKADPK